MITPGEPNADGPKIDAAMIRESLGSRSFATHSTPRAFATNRRGSRCGR